jgi:hypothetical protein
MGNILLLLAMISSCKGLFIWSFAQCCVLCLMGACCQVADLALTLRVSRQDLVGCVLANQARQVEESDFEETGLLRFGLVTLAGGEDSLALRVLWLRVVELSARCLGTAVSQVQGGPS